MNNRAFANLCAGSTTSTLAQPNKQRAERERATLVFGPSKLRKCANANFGAPGNRLPHFKSAGHFLVASIARIGDQQESKKERGGLFSEANNNQTDNQPGSGCAGRKVKRWWRRRICERGSAHLGSRLAQGGWNDIILYRTERYCWLTIRAFHKY